mmetsp:Transcript_15275/g.39371  ORF Transcript_15275/g.39371 Transcript_15275/m.39371 type:complete len:373 (+) Transcript_15275:269-1387(+)
MGTIDTNVLTDLAQGLRAGLLDNLQKLLPLCLGRCGCEVHGFSRGRSPVLEREGSCQRLTRGGLGSGCLRTRSLARSGARGGRTRLAAERGLPQASQPWVLRRVCGTRAEILVYSEQPTYELPGLGGEPRKPLTEVWPPFPSLLIHLVLCACVEGLAGKQRIDDDADRPHVCLLSVRAIDDLRREVITRATRVGHPELAIPTHCETEVNELDLTAICPSIHDVLELDVSVHDLPVMQIPHGFQELPRQIGGVTLRVLPAQQDCVEQLATVHALQDHVQDIIRHVHAVQPHNVRAVDGCVHFDFALQVQPRPSRERGQVVALDRHPLPGLPADGCSNLAARARAKHLRDQLIVTLEDARGSFVLPGRTPRQRR